MTCLLEGLTLAPFADPLRFGIAAISGFGIGLTLLTVFHYNRLIRHGFKVLLPRRVAFLLTVSYLLATAYIGADVLSRLGEPICWQLPVGVIVTGFGLPGLIMALQYIQRKDKELSHGPSSSDNLPR